MKNTVVIGAQWGDEGKGKVVDYLSEHAEVVVRFQGGTNAGHTVMVGDDEYILHLIPSGIVHADTQCLIGNGVVVDPPELLKEMAGLEEKGITLKGRFWVSERAHVIMPYHKLLDSLDERLMGSKKIGTTKRGIGPAYADKASRVGIRMGDLLNPPYLKERLEATVRLKNLIIKEFFNEEGFDPEELYHQALEWGETLMPFITNIPGKMREFIAQKKTLLFEGAQGTMLDIDYGTYPYVTSSHTTIGGVCAGAGVNPSAIDEVIGIAKAYTTRVGGGPFPTEENSRMGEHLREKGGEYGATTGRPRRCGWLDLVVLRHAVWLNGLTGIALTKIDVLDGLKEIPVCVAYEVNGRRVEEFPAGIGDVAEAKPVFEVMQGWTKPVCGATSWEQLPEEAKRYVGFMEERLGVPVKIVSTGPCRESTLVR